MSGDYVQKLQDCNNELQSIRHWVSQNLLDSNVRFLTNYAVVRASGTLELVFKQMMYDYLSDGANQEAKKLLNRDTIGSSFNLSSEKIYDFLAKVNSAWGKTFKKKIKNADSKWQLTSLVNLRNSFSHGNAITVSIKDVIDYFNSGVWILQQVNEIIGNDSSLLKSGKINH